MALKKENNFRTVTVINLGVPIFSFKLKKSQDYTLSYLMFFTYA